MSNKVIMQASAYWQCMQASASPWFDAKFKINVCVSSWFSSFLLPTPKLVSRYILQERKKIWCKLDILCIKGKHGTL